MTPIERMARAMALRDARERVHFSGSSDEVWEILDDYTRQRFLSAARAALTALREPSEGMLRDGELLAHDIEIAWQAMIDKALEE